MSLFVDNKYTRCYYRILERPDISGYTEKHHIIPKSLGGSNDDENIRAVSARQHSVLHKLLVKMVVTSEHRKKMLFARWCMTRNANGKRLVTSRDYEVAKLGLVEALRNRPISPDGKKRLSEARKIKCKSMTPEEKFAAGSTGGKAHAEKLKTDPVYAQEYGNKQRSKTFKLTSEQCKKISKSKIGKPRSEELKLRLAEIALQRPKMTCQHCGKEAQASNFSRWHGNKCKLSKS